MIFLTLDPIPSAPINIFAFKYYPFESCTVTPSRVDTAFYKDVLVKI